jgi:ABC-type transport system involved in multi-copper enzyme maturation permease subunit
MLNLIKVELFKLKRRTKFTGILITLLLASFIILPVLYTEKGFHNWNEITTVSFGIISIITNIFTCILCGELFMEEYKTKTINIMFTYPISRTKIYFAKLAVNCLYCMIISALGAIIFFTVSGISNYVHPAVTDTFSNAILIKIVLSVVFYSIFNSFVSIIYSFFSTVKVSIIFMVVSCILILNATSNNDITQLWPYGLIPLGIALISTVLVFPIIRHINVKDVL